MHVEFVNHASLIISSGKTKIFCDPWLDGSIFNNGWSHIIKTKFDYEKFREINYIWFSHEHPDHFSTGTLKSIDENIRSKITVLYQSTKDKKVINFCKGLGFNTQELPNKKNIMLNDDFNLICGKSGFYDSWLYLTDKYNSLLNINDCHIDTLKDLKKINKDLRNKKIDILLSQFSYAAWRGNKNDSLLREQEAKNKIKILERQLENIKPKYFIPFASYIYFSHVENNYLNDKINKSYDLIDINKFTKTILMYPGDTWDPSEQFSNSENIKKYKLAYSKIKDLEYDQSDTIEYEKLTESALKCTNRIKKNNNRLILNILKNIPFIGIMRDVHFYVTDLKQYLVYNRHGLLLQVEENEMSSTIKKNSIKLSSNSLNFLFQFDWGLDTLLVNGRFNANPNGLLNLIKSFGVMTLNNIGKRLEFKLIFDFELLYFSFKSIYSAIGRYRQRMVKRI